MCDDLYHEGEIEELENKVAALTDKTNALKAEVERLKQMPVGGDARGILTTARNEVDNWCKEAHNQRTRAEKAEAEVEMWIETHRQKQERLEKEGEKAQRTLSHMSSELGNMKERCWKLMAELKRERGFVGMALRELGVPNADYPAPVVNAISFLQDILGREKKK
jgi:chromosome segregation ATPase